MPILKNITIQRLNSP